MHFICHTHSHYQGKEGNVIRSVQRQILVTTLLQRYSTTLLTRASIPMELYSGQGLVINGALIILILDSEV